jgi:hypothetical protein
MDDCSKLIKKGGSPSDVCLAAAAHHVAHDLKLFEEAWRERQTRFGYTLWFILARSLMDFFFDDQRRQHKDGSFEDSILAVDFPVQTGKEWAPFASTLKVTADKLPDYEATRRVTNKNAAHLTYSRINPDAQYEIGPSEPVHRFLTGVAAEWLSRLTPAARVWFGRSPSSG